MTREYENGMNHFHSLNKSSLLCQLSTQGLLKKYEGVSLKRSYVMMICQILYLDVTVDQFNSQIINY